MNQAAWLVARVRRLSSASLRNKSQLARDSSLFIAMAILETSRVILRHFRAEDVDLLSGLMANQDFMRFSLGVYTREQKLGFLEKVPTCEREGLPSQFAVEIKSEGTLPGYCGFFHQDVDGKSEIEIGYRPHPDYWNKGLDTEAAIAVRDHALRDLNLPRVISLIHPENIASRRVAEKIGTTLEKHTTFRGFPANVFSRSREQWLKEHVA